MNRKLTPDWDELATEPAAHAEIYREEMASVLSELRMIHQLTLRGAAELIDHFDARETRKIDDPVVDRAVRDIAAAVNRSKSLIDRLSAL